MPVKDLDGLLEPVRPNASHEPGETQTNGSHVTPDHGRARFITHRPRNPDSLDIDRTLHLEGLPKGTTKAYRFINSSHWDSPAMAALADDASKSQSLTDQAKADPLYDQNKHIYPPILDTETSAVRHRMISASHQPVPATVLFGKHAAPLSLPKLDAHLNELEVLKFSYAGRFAPMDRLANSGRSLEDLEFNRPIPPVWRDRNVITGATLNIILGFAGSSFAQAYYSLGGLLNTFQIFALILSSIVPGNSDTAKSWRTFILRTLPNALALTFATNFWQSVASLFIYIIIVAILLRKFYQFSRGCSRDVAKEGFYHPESTVKRWTLISVSFLLVVLYLPLSTIGLHVIIWSEDLWVVPNPYTNATIIPPPINPLGPSQEFRDPLNFCWTSTMRKNNINWAPVLVVMALAVWLMLTLWFPFQLRRVIQANAPKVDIYTELGDKRSESDLQREYLRLLDRDQNPFGFLYNHFRRNWAMYESTYLFIKVTTLLIVAVLDANNCLFRTLSVSGRETLLIARQTLLLCATLVFFAMQNIFAPFTDPVNNASEWVSRLGYVAVAGLSLGAYINTSTKPILLGPGLYIVYIITYGLSVYFTVIDWSKTHRLVKYLKRRIDFSIDIFSPRLDLTPSSPHTRRRIWQEMITTSILTSPECAMPKWQTMTFARAPDADTYPPYLLNFTGTPAERHVENLKILREVGLQAYDKADALVHGPDREWFSKLQQSIQCHFVGPDSFWQDPNSSRTGGFARFFGNAWWIPFPPTLVIKYDDGSNGILRTLREMEIYVEQNKSDSVRTRRHIRLALRALDGQYVRWTYQELKPVGSWTMWPIWRTRYHAVSSKLYHHCRLHIKRRGELPWEGFEFGSGLSVELQYTKSLKIESGAIGLNDDFELTDQLAQFLAQNEELISSGVGLLEASLQRYRDHYRRESQWKANVLSYRFLTAVYNRPHDPSVLTKSVLETEQDLRVRDLVRSDSNAISDTFRRLNLVSASPVRLFWYLFWDDIWRRNADVITHMRTHSQDFDPHYSSCIAYTPLSRANMEAFLVVRGLFSPTRNTRAWFHPGILNKLYLRLNDIVFMNTSKAILFHIGRGSAELDMNAVENLVGPSNISVGGGTSYGDVSIRARPNFKWEAILSDNVIPKLQWQNHLFSKLGSWFGLAPFWTEDASKGLSVDVHLDQLSGMYVLDDAG